MGLAWGCTSSCLILKNISSSSWCSGVWVCELQWKLQGAEVWPAGLLDAVLSTAAFADVSGCRVKASIAGVDEGTAGDQVSSFPPSLMRSLRGSQVLFCILLWGQWCCSCWTLVLPGVTSLCVRAMQQCSPAAGRGWWAVCYCSS